MKHCRASTRSTWSGSTHQRWCVLLIALITLWSVVAPHKTVMAETSLGSGSDEAESAAGLIIDTGEDEPVYVVVTFSGTAMSAIDLLRAADLSVVTVDFGGLGEAVCSIVTTGCDVATCRQRLCQSGDPESPFWQYWHLDEGGEWALSPLGGSHAEIGNGDIAAWAWTGIDPELEQLTWNDLASRAGAPDAVAQGRIAGDPSVYVSDVPDGPEQDGVAAETLSAVGIAVLIGGVGALLVLRQRREHGEQAS